MPRRSRRIKEQVIDLTVQKDVKVKKEDTEPKFDLKNIKNEIMSSHQNIEVIDLTLDEDIIVKSEPVEPKYRKITDYFKPIKSKKDNFKVKKEQSNIEALKKITQYESQEIDSEASLVIDESENIDCKYSKEIKKEQSNIESSKEITEYKSCQEDYSEGNLVIDESETFACKSNKEIKKEQSNINSSKEKTQFESCQEDYSEGNLVIDESKIFDCKSNKEQSNIESSKKITDYEPSQEVDSEGSLVIDESETSDCKSNQEVEKAIKHVIKLQGSKKSKKSEHSIQPIEPKFKRTFNDTAKFENSLKTVKSEQSCATSHCSEASNWSDQYYLEANQPEVKYVHRTFTRFLNLRVTGRVKWFNVLAGYGFIERDDKKEDLFVHESAISKKNPKVLTASLGDGEKVRFDVVVGHKDMPEAANVTSINGGYVQGSKYALEIRKRQSSKGSRYVLDRRNRLISDHIKPDLEKRRSRQSSEGSRYVLDRRTRQTTDHIKRAQERSERKNPYKKVNEVKRRRHGYDVGRHEYKRSTQTNISFDYGEIKTNHDRIKSWNKSLEVLKKMAQSEQDRYNALKSQEAKSMKSLDEMVKKVKNSASDGDKLKGNIDNYVEDCAKEATLRNRLIKSQNMAKRLKLDRDTSNTSTKSRDTSNKSIKTRNNVNEPEKFGCSKFDNKLKTQEEIWEDIVKAKKRRRRQNYKRNLRARKLAELKKQSEQRLKNLG